MAEEKRPMVVKWKIETTKMLFNTVCVYIRAVHMVISWPGQFSKVTLSESYEFCVSTDTPCTPLPKIMGLPHCTGAWLT